MGSKPYFTVLARSSKSTTLPSKPTDLACKRQNIITCSLNFGCHSVKTSWQFLLVTHCYSGGDSSTKAPCNKGKPPRRRPKEVRSPSPEISSQLGKTKNHQRHKIKKKQMGHFQEKSSTWWVIPLYHYQIHLETSKTKRPLPTRQVVLISTGHIHLQRRRNGFTFSARSLQSQNRNDDPPWEESKKHTSHQ